MSHEVQSGVEKKLRYISGTIKQNGRKILKKYPITSPQFIALQWLIEEGELTIGELSNKNGLEARMKTLLVNQKEMDGVVERSLDSNDRRDVRIQVLEKSKTIIHEVITERRMHLGDVLQNFSHEQTMQLDALLSLLHQQMKRVNEK